MKCSICTSEIDVQANGYEGGHNAFPLSNGRCCTKCNDTEVVPMRMAFVVFWVVQYANRLLSKIFLPSREKQEL